jgi:hypothetical protein
MYRPTCTIPGCDRTAWTHPRCPEHRPAGWTADPTAAPYVVQTLDELRTRRATL